MTGISEVLPIIIDTTGFMSYFFGLNKINVYFRIFKKYVQNDGKD